jgi:hypothetical protein
MPWPVRTSAMVQLESSAQCPLDADWILDSAAVPAEMAPPEMSSAEKLGDVVVEKGKQVKDSLLRELWIPLAIAGGVLLVLALGRRA